MSSPERSMKCETVRQLLAESDANALSAGVSPEIAEHLATCESCAEYHKELQSVSTGLGGLTVVAPSELYPQVMQALPAKPGVFSRKMILLLSMLIVALCALILEYYYFYGQYRQQEHVISTSCVETMSGVIPAPNTEEYSQTSQLTLEQLTPSQ